MSLLSLLERRTAKERIADALEKMARMDFAKRNAEAVKILAKRLLEFEIENEKLRKENRRLNERVESLASEIRDMLHQRDL